MSTTQKIIRLAYRNLFRNRRRTILAIFIIGAGYVAMGLAMGYYSFSMWGLREMTIRTGFGGSGGTAHIQIADERKAKQSEKYALELGVQSYQRLVAKLASDPAVDYVLPRIEFGGLLSNGDLSLPIIGNGILINDEAKLRSGLAAMDPLLGRLGNEILPLNKAKNGIIIGGTLANSLNAKVGQSLQVYGSTTDGTVNAVDAEVVGIINTGYTETDKYYLLTNIELAQQLTASDRVSSIAVMLKDGDNVSRQLPHIENIVQSFQKTQPLKAVGWESFAEFFRSIRDLFNIIFTFMGGIIMFIVFLSCWNITNINIMERIREIGTMRAIGIAASQIQRIFLIESLLTGIGGVVGGFLVQLLIASVLNYFHIQMPPIPGMNQAYYLQVYPLTIFHPFIAVFIMISVAVSSRFSFNTARQHTVVESLEHT